HDHMRHGPLLLEIGFAIGVAELPFGEVIGKAERHVAARPGKHVQQEAKALRATRDVLKYHAGSVLRPQYRPGRSPDVLLAIGAVDRAHFTQPLGEGKPLSQIVVGDVSGKVSLVDHWM